MKKEITFAGLMLAAMTVHADNYGFLMFEDTQGARQFVVSVGTEITFENGQMKVTNASTGESLNLSLSALDFMSFTTTNVSSDVVDPIEDPLLPPSQDVETAVNQLSAQGPRLSVQDGRLYVTAEAGTRVTVVALSGIVLADEVLTSDAPQQVGRDLQKGVYIVKTGRNTTKIQVR